MAQTWITFHVMVVPLERKAEQYLEGTGSKKLRAMPKNLETISRSAVTHNSRINHALKTCRGHLVFFRPVHRLNGRKHKIRSQQLLSERAEPFSLLCSHTCKHTSDAKPLGSFLGEGKQPWLLGQWQRRSKVRR